MCLAFLSLPLATSARSLTRSLTSALSAPPHGLFLLNAPLAAAQHVEVVVGRTQLDPDLGGGALPVLIC
jgi:hypothetical protein